MQLRHFVLKGMTIALIRPSREELIKARKDLETTGEAAIKLNLGIALLSKKDNYVKSIGRKLAIEKIQETELQVFNTRTTQSGEIFMNIGKEIKESLLLIELKISKGKNWAFFVDAGKYEF